MNRRVTPGLIVLVLILAGLVGDARAQAHVQLVGGMTQAAGREPFFGAGLGVRMAAVEVGVEGGYFKDILPKSVLSALNDLQRERNLPVQGIASVPGIYGMASVRLIPGIGPIRPFLMAGAGAVRLEPRIDVVVGDISLGDIFGLTSFGARTEPMATAAAGLRIDGGAVHVEGGYRFVVIGTDYEPFGIGTGSVLTHVNSVYVALGARF